MMSGVFAEKEIAEKTAVPTERRPLLDGSSRPKNLIFKGGGAKGLAYIGVQAALEACGFHFDSVERVGGASAGAINALALALGLTLTEAKRFILELDFNNIIDDAQSAVAREKLLGLKGPGSYFFKAADGASVASRAAPQLSTDLGLYQGEFIREFMEALVFHKTKIRDCTFQELHELRRSNPIFKDLYVIGFNLNTQVAQTFSFETTPTVIISDAIRVSMSIPFVFQPHCPYYKQSGDRVKDATGHLWIDGGVAENYPVSLFDWSRYVPAAGVGANEPLFNRETLGFYLTDTRRRDYLCGLGTRGAGDALPAQPIAGIQDYTKAIISAISGREDNDQVRRYECQRTIYIDDSGISVLDFDMTVAQKQMLLRAGWESVCKAYQRTLSIPAEILQMPEAVEGDSEREKKSGCRIS